ncbi:MAG: hypothetical protein INQ03_04745 [Candidatus Heimdallarchaeota archaeon]|nr:hypothetical protein [Candidatus Heimdallarchaeota archaeon]
MKKLEILSIFLVVIISFTAYANIESANLIAENVYNMNDNDNNNIDNTNEFEDFDDHSEIDDDQSNVLQSSIELDGSTDYFYHCEVAFNCMHVNSPSTGGEPQTLNQVPGLFQAYSILLAEYALVRADPAYTVTNEKLWGFGSSPFKGTSWEGVISPASTTFMPIVSTRERLQIPQSGTYVRYNGAPQPHMLEEFPPKFNGEELYYLYFTAIASNGHNPPVYLGDGEGVVPDTVVRFAMPYDRDKDDPELLVEVISEGQLGWNPLMIYDLNYDSSTEPAYPIIIFDDYGKAVIPSQPWLLPDAWDETIEPQLVHLNYYHTQFTIEDALEAVVSIYRKSKDFSDSILTEIFLRQSEYHFSFGAQDTETSIMYIVEFAHDYARTVSFMNERFPSTSTNYIIPSNTWNMVWADPAVPVSPDWNTLQTLSTDPITETVDTYQDGLQMIWDANHQCLDLSCMVYPNAYSDVVGKEMVYFVQTLSGGIINKVKKVINWLTSNNDDGDDGGDDGNGGTVTVVPTPAWQTQSTANVIRSPTRPINPPMTFFEIFILVLAVILGLMVIGAVLYYGGGALLGGAGSLGVPALVGLIIILAIPAVASMDASELASYGITGYDYDTDNDNLPDWYEVNHGLSDPTIPNRDELEQYENNFLLTEVPLWDIGTPSSWSVSGAKKHEGPYSLEMKSSTTKTYEIIRITSLDNVNTIEAWVYMKSTNYGMPTLYLGVESIDQSQGLPIESGYMWRHYKDHMTLYKVTPNGMGSGIMTDLGEYYTGYKANSWFHIKLETSGNEARAWYSTSAAFTEIPQRTYVSADNIPLANGAISGRVLGTYYPVYFDELKLQSEGNQYKYNTGFNSAPKTCAPIELYTCSGFDSRNNVGGDEQYTITTYDGRTVMRSVEDYSESTYRMIDHNRVGTDMSVETSFRVTNQYKTVGLAVRVSNPGGVRDGWNRWDMGDIPHTFHVKNAYGAFFYKSELRLYRIGAYKFAENLKSVTLPSAIHSGWKYVKMQIVGNNIKVWYSSSSDYGSPILEYNIGMDQTKLIAGSTGVFFRKLTSSAYGYTHFDTFETSPIIGNMATWDDVAFEGEAVSFRPWDLVDLTPNINSAYGTIYMQQSNVEELMMSFTFLSAATYGTTGADAVYAYLWGAGTFSSEDDTTGGVLISVDYWADTFSIKKSGSVLSSISISEVSNGQMHTVDIQAKRTGDIIELKVSLDNVVMVNVCYDYSGGSLGNYFGIGARTGGYCSHNQLFDILFMMDKSYIS